MGFTIRLDIIFTKLLRHFTKCWERRGIKTIICIDDSFASFRGFEIAKSICELTRNDLVFTAFAINNGKSDFNPKTKGKWLNTVINPFTKKNYKTFSNYNQVFKSTVFDPKTNFEGTKVLGQFYSMNLAIGQLVLPFTRNMYHITTLTFITADSF